MCILGQQIIVYTNLVKYHGTFLFVIVFFFSAFELVSFYQGPIDREVAQGSLTLSIISIDRFRGHSFLSVF